MSVSGIGTAGYPVAGYETRKTERAALALSSPFPVLKSNCTNAGHSGMGRTYASHVWQEIRKLQRCRAESVLRTLWYLTLAAFANWPCKHGRLAHCPQE